MVMNHKIKIGGLKLKEVNLFLNNKYYRIASEYLAHIKILELKESSIFFILFTN